MDTARAVRGEGHGAVLAAVRTLLADGKAYSAEELCALGIEHGLLPGGDDSEREITESLADFERENGPLSETVRRAAQQRRARANANAK